MSDTRQHVHELIDRLPPEKLSAAAGLLELLLHSLDRALAAAEIDDEPLSEEERRDIEASREWFKHNEGIPFERVVADLGLTMEEVTDYLEPS
jgi:hypothetical protein